MVDRGHDRAGLSRKPLGKWMPTTLEQCPRALVSQSRGHSRRIQTHADTTALGRRTTLSAPRSGPGPAVDQRGSPLRTPDNGDEARSSACSSWWVVYRIPTKGVDCVRLHLFAPRPRRPSPKPLGCCASSTRLQAPLLPSLQYTRDMSPATGHLLHAACAPDPGCSRPQLSWPEFH